MKRGKFVTIAGVSAGSGKTAIMAGLLKIPGLNLVQLFTYVTRKPRTNDYTKEHHHFVTEKEFLKLKTQKFFVETKRLFHIWYGSPKKDIEDNLARGKNVVSDVDPQRILLFKKHFPDMIGVFVDAPNKFLRMRMSARGDSPDEQKARLRVASRERRFKRFYDLTVVNDEGKLEKVVKTIADYLKKRLH